MGSGRKEYGKREALTPLSLPPHFSRGLFCSYSVGWEKDVDGESASCGGHFNSRLGDWATPK